LSQISRRQRQTLARWADGTTLVRRRMSEAGKQFRDVNGHVHLPTLRAALERESAEPVGPVVRNDQGSAA
jgi:putative transposase